MRLTAKCHANDQRDIHYVRRATTIDIGTSNIFVRAGRIDNRVRSAEGHVDSENHVLNRHDAIRRRIAMVRTSTLVRAGIVRTHIAIVADQVSITIGLKRIGRAGAIVA